MGGEGLGDVDDRRLDEFIENSVSLRKEEENLKIPFDFEFASVDFMEQFKIEDRAHKTPIGGVGEFKQYFNGGDREKFDIDRVFAEYDVANILLTKPANFEWLKAYIHILVNEETSLPHRVIPINIIDNLTPEEITEVEYLHGSEVSEKSYDGDADMLYLRDLLHQNNGVSYSPYGDIGYEETTREKISGYESFSSNAKQYDVNNLVRKSDDGDYFPDTQNEKDRRKMQNMYAKNAKGSGFKPRQNNVDVSVTHQELHDEYISQSIGETTWKSYIARRGKKSLEMSSKSRDRKHSILSKKERKEDNKKTSEIGMVEYLFEILDKEGKNK